MNRILIFNPIKKTALALLIATVLLSCKSETKPSIVENPLTQYETIREMLEDGGDFYEENGSLKFMSEEKANQHIQVSKPISKNDLENVKHEIVKRDIVYVAFQAFAQTNLNEITITSIPMDLEDNKRYYDEYKQTIKVDRVKAKSILKKYFGNDDFSILFENENGIWLPNKNFDKLKFEKLEYVYKAIESN